MADLLPEPSIPGLLADNTLDLEQLGDDDLRTFINYPALKHGDQLWPQWRGCSAQGEAVDTVDTKVIVDADQLEPEGQLHTIANSLLKRLDQGWVFYSYALEVAPGVRGDESRRLFFYVGKPARTRLPVPQVKESNGLALDPGLPDLIEFTVVTLPYRAMAIDDRVTLLWRGFYDGEEVYVDEPTKILTAGDIGQPLAWKLDYSKLGFLDGWYAEVSFSVVYATSTEKTVSAMQTLQIIKPVAPLLPPVEFQGNPEDSLDPDQFRNGLTLNIAPWPGMQVGDDVLVYGTGTTSTVRTLRIDPSNIDSGLLTVTLDYAWLSANSGSEVTLIWQYARQGAAGTSLPLTLMLRKPLNLPPPIVENAIPEDADDESEFKGFLLAANLRGGVYINLPDAAVIGPSDKVQMVWDGFGTGGRQVANPTVANPKRFLIRSEFVPANIGKRLKVFYEVTQMGEVTPYTSKVFDLWIKDIEVGWPSLQLVEPAGSLSLIQVPDTGAKFTLASWTFMAVGQRVKIKASGLLSPQSNGSFDMRVGATEVVTTDEYNDGQLIAYLPLSFLQTLQLGSVINFAIDTSFDEGSTYKQFPGVNIQLVP